MAQKQKYYVVWNGINPGIYSTWSECEKQVKGYIGAKYMSFETKEMASTAFLSSPYEFLKTNKAYKREFGNDKAANIDYNSISVDAACSGNPGRLEYRGVETKSKKELFKMGPFENGTVNIGEFLAIVHGLAFLKKNNSKLAIYTDSKTALSWLKAKKSRTKLEKDFRNQDLFDLLLRAENWLRDNTYDNKVVKWETSIWGEIPADFGRK